MTAGAPSPFLKILQGNSLLSGLQQMILSPENPVEEIPQAPGHDKPSCYIDDRVLLQKHGGEHDQNGQDQGSPSDHIFFLKVIAVPDCNTGGNRVEHMEAREHIGGSIRVIENLYNGSQNIVSGIYFRPKLQSVGPYK